MIVLAANPTGEGRKVPSCRFPLSVTWRLAETACWRLGTARGASGDRAFDRLDA